MKYKENTKRSFTGGVGLSFLVLFVCCAGNIWCCIGDKKTRCTLLKCKCIKSVACKTGNCDRFGFRREMCVNWNKLASHYVWIDESFQTQLNNMFTKSLSSELLQLESLSRILTENISTHVIHQSMGIMPIRTNKIGREYPLEKFIYTYHTTLNLTHKLGVCIITVVEWEISQYNTLITDIYRMFRERNIRFI